MHTRTEPGKARMFPTAGAEKTVPFAEVTIAALAGKIRAEHLVESRIRLGRGSTLDIGTLDNALPDLAEEGNCARWPSIHTWRSGSFKRLCQMDRLREVIPTVCQTAFERQLTI